VLDAWWVGGEHGDFKAGSRFTFHGHMAAVAGVVSTDSGEVQRLSALLAREERISRALQEVSVALGTTLDLDDLLELILGRITELLDADRSTLYLVDDAKGDLISRVVIGSKVRSIRIKLGHGIAGTVAKTGKPIRVKEAYKDPRFEPEWDLLTGYRTTCMLAAPLKNHLARTIGVVQVLNKSTGEFTDEDEAILTALSTQAAVAIDNSRLFLSLIQKNRQLLDTKDQLERKVRDLQFLFDLERSTSRATSLEQLIVAALRTVANACEARAGTLLMAMGESGDLVQYVLDADDPDELQRLFVKHGEGLLGQCMSQSTVVETKLGVEDERASPRIEGQFPFTVETLFAVPMDGESASLGAIGLVNKRGQQGFGQEDASLLQLIAANVSTALRLYQANEERERSARLTTIGRLLSQVIHDFKTPLTVISGHVQLMQNSNDAEARAAHAKKILKQFDVLQSMQKEVLEFARGERTLFVRRVYLHKFFSELRQELSHELDGRAIELEMDIDNKVVARFDENRIGRALQNLARNAIEAMAEKGGVLKIEARLEGDDLLIAVSDTGPGIPEAVLGRMFQSFVTLGKPGGTGLGLAIVKKIVDEHGGRIETHSSSAGARFELRLPQDNAPPSTRGPRRAPRVEPASDPP
jgi:signal transduction histidine kinase/putative methionine-R-sulfoxide reductase with GAF domain